MFFPLTGRIGKPMSRESEERLLVSTTRPLRGLPMEEPARSSPPLLSLTLCSAVLLVPGLDMSMPGDIIFKSNTSYWGYNLTESVRNGSVPESRVDVSLLSLLFVRSSSTLTSLSFSYPRTWPLESLQPTTFWKTIRIGLKSASVSRLVRFSTRPRDEGS